MVLISLFAVALAVATPVETTSEPQASFTRYAAPTFKSKFHAPLRLGGDSLTHRFRSALVYAYDADVDFAGHYVLAEIGCGAGCVQVAALDTRTGNIRWFPFTVSGWSKAKPDPLEYETYSRLLIVHGQLDEHGDAGTHAFVFNGHSFAALRASRPPQ